ncbi:alpha/beta hydrolase [Sphingobium sufflavum]|uniref:alpha/beta fold hydrolase n=1 Tax=Sphingobium sufflavum TaxID=1129547 RepID=UPI001F30CEBE|nr:alpha/beta hydrolase [Sphingobium sufflavum]MCE7795726.1 alpha/beta hydrolase [Sphingobium sufflavum]
MTQSLSPEPVSRTIDSQGLAIHYLDWGNAGAPVLILLHGNADHARSWDWTARALRDRFHVVAMDLRGHGDSDWSADGGYLAPYHVLDLVELVDHLGADKVTILGHSFGGNISWHYAALYPDRVEKLVVVDGLGPAPNAIAGWDAVGPVVRLREWVEKRRNPRATSQRRFATIEEMVERMAKGNPHLSAEQARHLAIHGARQHPDGWSWKFDPRVQMFAPHDFAVGGEAFWQGVTVPTLLYYGTESWTTDPEEDGRARHLRDHRTIVYDGAGHWVHHDRFDDFIASLTEFL